MRGQGPARSGPDDSPSFTGGANVAGRAPAALVAGGACPSRTVDLRVDPVAGLRRTVRARLAPSSARCCPTHGAANRRRRATGRCGQASPARPMEGGDDRPRARDAVADGTFAASAGENPQRCPHARATARGDQAPSRVSLSRNSNPRDMASAHAGATGVRPADTVARRRLRGFRADLGLGVGGARPCPLRVRARRPRGEAGGGGRGSSRSGHDPRCGR